MSYFAATMKLLTITSREIYYMAMTVQQAKRDWKTTVYVK